MNAKKKALGKGLSALLENATEFQQSTYTLGSIFNVNLDIIEANPYQPRNDFEEEALKELAESIDKIGIIQPITICKTDGQKFKLISGERRFRAAKINGMKEIPAYIRGADSDEEMLQMALIENIQREDLNPMEVALSFQRFVDEFELTQEELSEKVGKKRSTVANYMRLLKLPLEIQAALRDNKLSMGHARALISVGHADEQLKIFNRIIHKGLSVREVEKIVQDLTSGKAKQTFTKNIKKKIYSEVKKNLSEKLGMKVDVKQDNKGIINVVIKCQNDEQLDKIVDSLNN